MGFVLDRDLCKRLTAGPPIAQLQPWHSPKDLIRLSDHIGTGDYAGGA